MKRFARIINHQNEKSCGNCQKLIAKNTLCWFEGETDVQGVVKDFFQCQYFCLSCGNQIVEKDKSPAQLQGHKCFYPGCQREITEKKGYYQCRDSNKKMCSKEHFKEIYRLYCDQCGIDITERADYLQVVASQKPWFQKVFPWVTGGLVLFITVLMIILVKKEERKKVTK
ncbi:hypothetical protein [endosymbiont GvMRE of Glomus versiforme]|uniref:hypothetical protein n=1 Tax=endosymbiont GvMRE of Glomus versiforme TaxID=2039283 RepID=UPI000EDFDDA1|nr:hypothetical protein [endosymbiont GvMRE of Glomus versiforme]RHZ36368.1 hypothetical protein GvMRE_Ic1g148 [endosymbiont GvMRE of Glomus versiforme]